MKVIWKILFIVAVFLPRLIIPDNFFIQDEQPWVDRSQVYVNSLFAGDFTGAVRFPLSNHPAIPLMTVVGPVVNMYQWSHGLNNTYEAWSFDDKREAAVWARYIWGIACSVALLLLYGTITNVALFKKGEVEAALFVVLFGLEPWIWGISRSVSVDVLMAISVVGMLLSAVVAYEKRSIIWTGAAGTWLALAFTSKSPALITAPIAFILASYIPRASYKEIAKRASVFFGTAYVFMCVIWPPFILHPIRRILDVLSRAELHSTVQEIYYWPGYHPPLFVFTLSSFAFVGCLLYCWHRFVEIRKNGFQFAPLDVLLLAGLWHGLLLIYLNGDHARKNLPAIAMLACIGIIGWLTLLMRHKVDKTIMIGGLIVLQGIFVWPYFPHVISSYNILFPSEDGKRLLVDVGNGSRLISEYINNSDPEAVFSIPMDSLVAPYVDATKRGNIRGLPNEGDINNLDSKVTDLIIPESLPARTGFDSAARLLLEQLQGETPKTILSVRDVPMFLVYSINHE